MKEIDEIRTKINEIDKEIAALFEERMSCVKEVAAYKKERGLPIKDATRETALIERNLTYLNNPDISEYYITLQKDIMGISCKYQERLNSGLKVAYCGVEGAFAHIAAKKMYPNADILPYPTFADAYMAVEKGDCDAAILPLENSYAGEVDNVFDLLFTGSLYVNRVMELPVSHCLIAKQGTSKENIKKIISHPQALKQCDGYINKNAFEYEECSNTALAAKIVRDSEDDTLAAIASSLTAELYGLKIIEGQINDSRNNTTRFASFSRVQNTPTPSKVREDENFILVFTVQNKAGALAQTLNIIGAHGYNMRSLRSRPMKGLEWQYFFYIEAEGNVSNENGRNLIRELSAICARLKLVGAYYTEKSED